MVDPINSSSIARLRPTDPLQGRHSDPAPQSPTKAEGAPASADTVALSDDVSVAMERLSKLDPPIDAARVALVKAEILGGSYPLDSQRLADAFFRDIGALMEQ